MAMAATSANGGCEGACACHIHHWICGTWWGVRKCAELNYYKWVTPVVHPWAHSLYSFCVDPMRSQPNFLEAKDASPQLCRLVAAGAQSLWAFS